MLLSLKLSLVGAFQGIWEGVVAFIPHLFWALVVFAFAWIIGSFVGKVVAHLIKAAKLDSGLEHAGFGNIVRRAGLTLNSGAFLGGLVKWFVIAVGIVAAFEVIGLPQVNLFLRATVLSYLPLVIVAILIILVAIVIADVVSKIVVSSAKAADIKSANFLGALTRWVIWIFAILIGLTQIGIADTLVNTFFTGITFAVALAVGLAFGLGGRDAAARSIEKIQQQIADHKNN